MAGKLIVAGRAADRAGWRLLGIALTAAEATPIVDGFLAEHASGRVVVAQVVRSFQAAPNVTEDNVATIEP